MIIVEMRQKNEDKDNIVTLPETNCYRCLGGFAGRCDGSYWEGEEGAVGSSASSI